MKRDIIFITICFIMFSCGLFGRDYPAICVITAYVCGSVITLTQESKILDYIKKKLN